MQYAVETPSAFIQPAATDTIGTFSPLGQGLALADNFPNGLIIVHIPGDVDFEEAARRSGPTQEQLEPTDLEAMDWMFKNLKQGEGERTFYVPTGIWNFKRTALEIEIRGRWATPQIEGSGEHPSTEFVLFRLNTLTGEAQTWAGIWRDYGDSKTYEGKEASVHSCIPIMKRIYGYTNL